MARTARDMALMLDVIVGYDPEDPVTALGVGHKPKSYTVSLVENGLAGARIGILRESIGSNPDPKSEDFGKVDAVFQRAVGQLRDAGAVLVDPIVIPNLKELLAQNAGTGHELTLRLKVWLARNPSSPFKSLEDIKNSPRIGEIIPPPKAEGWKRPHQPNFAAHAAGVYAREKLMVSIMNVMAAHNLDAIVYKSVEHQPGLIDEALRPPYPGPRGVNVLNTFLVYAATIAVPAGLTSDGLPAGITFFGRPYSEPLLFKLAYGYEQAVRPRTPPSSTPPLR
jgi:Asp-tRNA(Asn)/Glu-tRNA(Gln) amidotransferase A subunit family amidase